MKRKGKGRGIIIQLAIAMPVLTIAFAFGAAKLILSEAVPQAQGNLCIYVYTAVISFILCIYCALRVPQKKLLWGMLTACCYLCLLLLGNLLFFGIGYGHILPVASCVLGGGLLGSFLGAGKRRKYA